MTREGIIEQLKDSGLSRENAHLSVDTFFNEISQALEKEEPVTLKNFATFLTKEKSAIRYFNKAKGEEEILPAKRIIKVKFSGSFRERVNASTMKGGQG